MHSLDLSLFNRDGTRGKAGSSPSSDRQLPSRLKTTKTVPLDPNAYPRLVNMSVQMVLASGSEIRAQLLRQAGLEFRVVLPRIDEESVSRALEAESARPRDIADTLAEMKARRVAGKEPDALVLGFDQVLDFNGSVLTKPESPEQAIAQITAMQGQRHMLLSAAVIVEKGEPIWRHVGQVRLRMRSLSPGFIDAYVARNWDSIRHAVGAYKLEEEGVRLFSAIEGSYFNVLGLPLIELLNYLELRGLIET